MLPLRHFGDRIDRALNAWTIGIVTAALIIGTSIVLTVPGEGIGGLSSSRCWVSSVPCLARSGCWCRSGAVAVTDIAPHEKPGRGRGISFGPVAQLARPVASSTRASGSCTGSPRPRRLAKVIETRRGGSDPHGPKTKSSARLVSLQVVARQETLSSSGAASSGMTLTKVWPA